MKKIAVDIQQHIKDVVEIENRILFAIKPNITIPKMKYQKASIWSPTGRFVFLKSIMP